MLFMAIQAFGYPEEILAMQPTELKKHLEECSSIRPGIMDPLRAMLCKYSNVILSVFTGQDTASHGSGQHSESAGLQELGPLPLTPKILFTRTEKILKHWQ